MKIERTHDMVLARRMSLHQAILPGCDDDRYDPAAFNWPAADHPCAIWLAVREGGAAIGLFLFHPVPKEVSGWREDAQFWEAHAMFLPGARGRTSLKAYRLALEWMWSNTEALMVIGCTPEDNKAAIRMAVWAGMRRTGVRIQAYRRGGRWVNGILTLIRHPEHRSIHKEVA